MDLGDHLYHFSDEKKMRVNRSLKKGKLNGMVYHIYKKIKKRYLPSPTFRASTAGTLVRVF